MSALLAAVDKQYTSTFTNPILPGWHSDPTCIFVPEWNNTFFCVTSTFLVFPGLPLYASRDLQNWKLICNIFNRPSQVPRIGTDKGQNNGLFAPTLRYRNGIFHVITEYVTINEPPTGFGLVFTSRNPYDAMCWGEPVIFREPNHILDPDLFWDDDGTLYVQAGSFNQNIVQFSLDMETGRTGPERVIWEGTGQIAPEGPHMYKKDDFYYLMISEGGTDLPHSIAIARSRSPSGPFHGYEGNPILTNRDTPEYFQTVGHADLFHDSFGNWWGVALATRSGPEYVNYPMGRETVLFPATWNEGEWPRLEPVRGRMAGWTFPPKSRNIAGGGPFLGDADIRFPPQDAFVVSPAEGSNALEIAPSKSNLTGSTGTASNDPISLVARRQTSTIFEFSVDISFTQTVEGEEVGITAFLTQLQHISLGVVLLPIEDKHSPALDIPPRRMIPHFRFQIVTPQNHLSPQPAITMVPKDWVGANLRLKIAAINQSEYIFSARLPGGMSQQSKVLGTAPGFTISGGTGLWTGSLIGVYATSNGGLGITKAYVSRWRYDGQRQYIGNGEWV